MNICRTVLLLISSLTVFGFHPSPYLNDLMIFNNGTQVTDLRGWMARRVELKDLLQDHILGRLPSEVPSLISSKEVNYTVSEAGVRSTFVQLNYSCGVTTYIEVLYSEVDVMQNKSLPVFATQWNHRLWAALAVTRGYVGITYMGADIADSAPDFQQAYKNSSMMLIMARAFVLSRVLDYVVGLPYVNKSQISVSGHSRNGKQSLIAAAFDERITSVVGSSPGAPIASPFHFTSSNYYGEGPRTGRVAGFWWLESILQYDEHPENLPIDGHAVLSLIAPRHMLVSTGRTDFESDMTFAGEMCVRSASLPYQRFFNKPEHIRLMTRDGDHHGFNDHHTYFDWIDLSFNRRVRHLGNKNLCTDCFMVHPEDLSTYTTAAGFSWSSWNETYGSLTPPMPPNNTHIIARMAWLLQLTDSPFARSSGNVGEESKAYRYIPGMMRHTVADLESIESFSFSFGEDIDGTLYWPKNISLTDQHPVMVWLHPYSYNTGFSPAYMQSNVAQDLANSGYVVATFDLIGFGHRNFRGGNVFYDRYGGRSSLFGRMTQEVTMLIDFLTCRVKSPSVSKCGSQFQFQQDQFDSLPLIDPTKITVAGYSLGGNVAIHSAVLDPRISAVATLSSWTPMRSDTSDLPTGGLSRLFDLHGLIPRLGFFLGKEGTVPYDYKEILSYLASRSILVHAPQHDRDATFSHVADTINSVKASSPKLTFSSPNRNSTMEPTDVAILKDWYSSLLKIH
eukprot:TRINITY_DN3587_c0_g1_i1.p1 TRINITY_DN3587_c0_g1~~TRINITY_DN3587_c0_g1_i1.p1  ORF type:complete len:744 (+),score=98.51 TRINITY_DN3587_c0_g1_i1:34-2232(+)